MLNEVNNRVQQPNMKNQDFCTYSCDNGNITNHQDEDSNIDNEAGQWNDKNIGQHEIVWKLVECV